MCGYLRQIRLRNIKYVNPNSEGWQRDANYMNDRL